MQGKETKPIYRESISAENLKKIERVALYSGIRKISQKCHTSHDIVEFDGHFLLKQIFLGYKMNKQSYTKLMIQQYKKLQIAKLY